MALITTDVVKSDWLNLTTGTHDDLIARLIEAATAEINSICNQPLDAAATIKYVQGNNRSGLALPFTVPFTLTTIETRNDPTESWSVVTGGTSYSAGAGVKLYLANGFVNAFYKVTATVGYADGQAPADVKMCAYELVKEAYYNTPFAPDAERFGVTATTTTDAGLSISKAIATMRPRIMDKLAPYRVYTF